MIKVTVSVLSIVAIMFAISVFDTSVRDKGQLVLPHDLRPDNLTLPTEGCVPDSITAIRIAEAIWLSAYGTSIYDRRPFVAEKMGDTVWIVAGTLPKKTLGGVPYIELRRMDGKVLGVGHGK